MRPLPVTAAVSHALLSTINNLHFAFHASWPWLLILLPIYVFGRIYTLGSELPFDPETFQVDPAWAAVTIGGFLANAIAFASIAVNWHRYVLLDELPEGFARLRIDWTVWRYFGNTILITLIIALGVVALAAVLFVLTRVLGGLAALVSIPSYAVAVLIAIVASYRLAVKLPGIAVEHGGFGLADAWRATAGSFWQFLGLAVVLFFIGIAVALAGALIAAGVGMLGTAGSAIAIAIQLILNWLLIILSITMLTSLYGYFVEGRDF